MSNREDCNVKKMVSKKKQGGFTLIEIGIALAVLAVLGAFLISGLMKKQQDAKYSTTLQLLQQEFPSAIVAQVARTNRCTSATVTRDNLIKRGVPPQTVWFADWSVSVSGNNVSVTYPLDSDDPATGADLKTALDANPNVVSVTAPTTGVGNLVVVYRCN